MSAPGFYELAAPIGDTGANSFLNDSAAGKALVAICGAVAVVIVVFAVFRMINGIGRGRPGEAFKSLIFGLLIGGLLFNLNLTITGVNMMGDLVGKIFSSVDSVSNSGG
jgi:hypothetical protein